MKRFLIYSLATLTLLLSCNSCFLLHDAYRDDYYHEAPPPPPPPKKPTKRPPHHTQAPPPPPAGPQDHPHRR